MVDLLQEYVNSEGLSETSVLNYVDDYSLFSFYIGTELELRTKYSSPLRLGDSDPSFSIYYSTKYPGKIFFKDHSTGRSGDVFIFLRELLGNGERATLRTVLLQINKDFELGLTGEDVANFNPKLIKKAPLNKETTKITITSHKEPSQEFLDYWLTLDISLATRERYFVKNPYVIHYITEDQHTSIVPKSLTISYEILGTYKVYQPYERREFKFRNNFHNLYVEGAMQLDFKLDFAIITKAMKECIFFREHFGWETVAGKSENTPINPYFMENVLKKKYKKVFIWLDPDEAGQRAQQRYIDEYPWLIPIQFDDYIQLKDPTDLYTEGKKVNKQKSVLRYLKQLITKHL